MKVAICSSDGSNVNLHFGKTDMFYVFDIVKGNIELMEKRRVGKVSPDENISMPTVEPPEQEKIDVLFKTISDCREVYTLSIDDVPKQKLSENGIAVQLCNCPIESITTSYGYNLFQ